MECYVRLEEGRATSGGSAVASGGDDDATSIAGQPQEAASGAGGGSDVWTRGDHPYVDAANELYKCLIHKT